MESILQQLNFLKYTKEDFYIYKDTNEIILIESVQKKLDLIKKNISKNSKLNIHNTFEKNRNEKYDKKNSYVKSWRTSKTIIKKKDLTIVEKYCNEINSLLNKLSPKNFETIQDKVLLYYEKEDVNNEILKELIFFTINNIFSKAVSQPVYCPYYVKLLKTLDEKFETNDIIDKKCNAFKDAINKTNNDNESNTNKNPKSEQEKYDNFCLEIKEKKFKEGYSQFIGELYNNKMIKYDTLDVNINTFFELLDNEIKTNSKSDSVESYIISLSKLFTTIVNNLDSQNVTKIIDKFKNIQRCDLIKRLKFKLMDITDKY